jgi:signal transduction histidine kinase
MNTQQEISVVREIGQQVPTSLRLKTVLSVFIVALLLGVSGITFFLVSGIFERFAEAVRGDLTWKTQKVAAEMASKADVGLALADGKVVDEALRGYIGTADIQGWAALDKGGRVLKRAGDLPLPALELFKLPPGALGTGTDYFWSWSPAQIEGNELGKVAAVVSARRLHEGERLRTRILLIAGAACLAALLASFVFVGGYLGPVLRFAERTLQKLQHLNATLEVRVDDRTAALRNANSQLTESLAKIQNMQRQLMDASRRAGMADVATTVLHNVGNVLNSVNVSANVVTDTLTQSRLNGLARAADMIRAHKDDLSRFLTEDEKGRRIPLYVCSLADAAAEERASIVRELESLQKNIDHIKVIVSRQQAQAKTVGVIERISIPELLEDALKFVSTSYERHGLAVVREFQDIGSVRLDRHKLFQILMNLLSNARHAVKAVEDPAKEKRVVVRVQRQGEDKFVIEVEDTGCGIAAENLQKIFTYGFTTKEEGHGFGLHSSACAAAEMGGSISAHSDGPARGARFTITLPLEPPAAEVSSVDLPSFRRAAG